MGWQASVRAMQVAKRRQQREAAKQFRELERRAKEQAKLSEMERARLDVEAHEKKLEVLLSVHKEQSEPWDWVAVASSLPPPPPLKRQDNELRTRQCLAVLAPEGRIDGEAAVEQARQSDERLFQGASERHLRERAEWEGLKGLADRILAGEHKAYTEALVEFGEWGEISDLGSSVHFTVHDDKLVQCVLKVNGTQAIPAEVKTLTATGKLSTKAMPRAQFHEAYQDYVCGCMLRIAREAFALLPVETVLVTATVDMVDPRTGQMGERAVMSAAMARGTMAGLDYERLDPSDAMENSLCRGDFKASRKSGAFVPITPLTPEDLDSSTVWGVAVRDVQGAVRKMSKELAEAIERLQPASTALASSGEEEL